jgi:hypothetical protein
MLPVVPVMAVISIFERRIPDSVEEPASKQYWDYWATGTGYQVLASDGLSVCTVNPKQQTRQSPPGPGPSATGHVPNPHAFRTGTTVLPVVLVLLLVPVLCFAVKYWY